MSDEFILFLLFLYMHDVWHLQRFADGSQRQEFLQTVRVQLLLVTGVPRVTLFLCCSRTCKSNFGLRPELRLRVRFDLKNSLFGKIAKHLTEVGSTYNEDEVKEFFGPRPYSWRRGKAVSDSYEMKILRGREIWYKILADNLSKCLSCVLSTDFSTEGLCKALLNQTCACDLCKTLPILVKYSSS